MAKNGRKCEILAIFVIFEEKYKNLNFGMALKCRIIHMKLKFTLKVPKLAEFHKKNRIIIVKVNFGRDQSRKFWNHC